MAEALRRALRQIDLASKRTAIVVRMAPTATPELRASVLFSLGFLYDEMREAVAAAMAAVHSAIPGELVRINFDMSDGMTLPVKVSLALHQELEPFLIGCRESSRSALYTVAIVRSC